MSIRKKQTVRPSLIPRTRMQLGENGEKIAAAYLESKGLQIIERNWRTNDGEIDLIAMDGSTLCFIEVRTKTDTQAGHPLETITGPKQRQLIRMAQIYLQAKGQEDTPMRFDAIGIVVTENAYEISHIPDAFEKRY